MNIQDASYNSTNSAIHVNIDGIDRVVPVQSGNRFYDEIMQRVSANTLIVSAYSTPPPTVADVRAEAERRMILLTGARDSQHLDLIISKGNSEAIRLLRKGSANWDASETARAAQLETADAALEFIRAKSNILEAADPIPSNYDNDSHWT